MATVTETMAALAAGTTTSEALADLALAAIADPAGEGARTFVRHDPEQVRRDARAADAQRAAGGAAPLLGIPVSVKDLFDIEGEVTTAGSIALKDAPPATSDAVIVQRLKAAGAVIVGATNMTEFAFSGIGINPHYGTPRNPYDRATGRVPGGSSSGAAVSVTDGMCLAAIGTDTGGSVRIPSALCGVTGFKPTQARVPLDGAFPLSTTLDSIGPLAQSVADCILLDQVLSGSENGFGRLNIAGCRFAVPQSLVLDGMDADVAAAFASALSRLSAAGLKIEDRPFSEFAMIPQINARGAFAGHEGYAIHRELLARRGDQFDPRVRVRLEAGGQWTEEDYRNLKAGRQAFITAVMAAMADVDALLLPTVPAIAPPIAAFDDEDFFHRVNLLMLRNPSVINMLDGCAVSLPCQRPGEAPVGLMIAGRHGDDVRILAMAAEIEQLLSADR